MSLIEQFGVRTIQYLQPVVSSEATGLVAEVFAQATREFQAAPPLTLHTPVPRLFAAVWSATREALVVGNHRVEKEVVAAGVSAANACPYCVDVHSVMIEAGDQAQLARALRNDEAPPDGQLSELVRWSKATLLPDASIVASPPSGLSVAHVATAVVFHYVNRVVNVFLREGSPLALAGPGWLRSGLASLASKTVGRATLEKQAAAGESLSLLEPLPARTGTAWVDADATIGLALARLFLVAREGRAGFISEEAAQRVETALAQWKGDAPKLGRGWLSAALSGLTERDLVSARLALLTARTAYQVTEEDVAAFRRHHPGDDALVRVVAWGAAVAAQRVASWLRPSEAT